MDNLIRVSLMCGSALLCLANSTTAQAQNTRDIPADETVDAKAIIVTALKRGESLLDTPASIAVIDQKELSASNVTSASGLGGIVPSFSFMQGVAGGAASFRGLGSNSADPSIENSVGGFNDGIFLGRSRDFTTPLYDLQQIEFVAGTQSTLLGKNTSLGAINITSRRPGSVFSANGSATYTTEVDAVTLRAGMDVPLGRDFAIRFAGFYNDEQGYTRNLFLGRDEQQVKDISGRAVLDGSISDLVRLTAIYQHDRHRSDGQYLELLNDPDGLVTFFAGTILGLPDSWIDITPDDKTVSGSERLDPSAPAVPLPFDDQDSDRATVILEIGTPGGSTLTAQTGYLNWNSSRRTDLDFTPLHLSDLLDDESNEVFSQELRFATPEGNAFSLLLGLYYYHNNYSLRRQFVSDFGENLDGFSRTKTDSFSVFGSGRYRFSDAFSVLAGLRHNMEDKSVFYDISGTLAIPLGPVTLNADTSHETDYNFGVEFTPNRDLLIYATYARGSKNGGFQSIPDSLALADYAPEIAKTIEVGAKYNLGAGSLELSVFDTRITGFQASRLTTSPGFPLPLNEISNVDARSTGAEATMRYQVSGNLNLSGTVAYTDARFTDSLVSEVASGEFITEIEDGMRLVRAPKWAAKFAYHFHTALAHSLEFSSTGTVRYQTEADLQFRTSQPFAPVTKEHATVDLELRLGNPSAGWSIAAMGNNLTNVRVNTFTSDYLLAGLIDPAATPAYYGRRNRPRTFSIQAAFEF